MAKCPWTQADIDFLRDNPDMSNAEVALILGRTRDSVGSKRSDLRRNGLSTRPYVQQRAPGWSILGRTLLAKTCTVCGLLLDAEWFGIAHTGKRDARCRRCHSITSRGLPERRQEWARRVQQETEAVAHRGAAEWTERDYEVIAREGLSLQEMATTLGRSLFAVATARHRLGIVDRCPPLPEPKESWRIRIASDDPE